MQDQFFRALVGSNLAARSPLYQLPLGGWGRERVVRVGARSLTLWSEGRGLRHRGRCYPLVRRRRIVWPRYPRRVASVCVSGRIRGRFAPLSCVRLVTGERSPWSR